MKHFWLFLGKQGKYSCIRKCSFKCHIQLIPWTPCKDQEKLGQSWQWLAHCFPCPQNSRCRLAVRAESRKHTLERICVTWQDNWAFEVVEPLCYQQWENSALEYLDGTGTVQPAEPWAWLCCCPLFPVCLERVKTPLNQRVSSMAQAVWIPRQQLQFLSHKIQVIQRLQAHPYTTNPALSSSCSDGEEEDSQTPRSS